MAKHISERPCVARCRRAFVALCLVVMAAPLVLTPFGSGSVDAEKREGASMPRLVVDGSPNLDFLPQLTAAYETRFALRGQLVEADAILKERLFGVSSLGNVVVGRDGWLFYAGTLDDYRRENQLSDRAIQNAAFNLALVQEQLVARGIRFCVVVPPNKNSLYARHMPSFELAGSGEGNLERLQAALDAHGVSTVDLTQLLAEPARQEQLYLARDSHWNNRGARRAYEAICAQLGVEPVDFAEAGTVEQVGDLELMLHPLKPEAEAQTSWDTAGRFAYVGDQDDVEAASLETEATGPAQGSLLMMRDSFGNALVPLFASTFAKARFSKMVPYDLGPAALRAVDAVVLERAERHLALFATDPPYLPAPQRTVGEGRTAETSTTVRMAQNGPYLVVEGTLLGDGQPEARHIYVGLARPDGSWQAYEAYHVSAPRTQTGDFEGDDAGVPGAVRSDEGYRAYVWVGDHLDEVTAVRVGVTASGADQICWVKECGLELSE